MMMKAAIATGIEDIDKYIHVTNDEWPKPTLSTAKDGKTGKLVSDLLKQHPQSYMIVKVLACALAPGDCRLFKGKTDMMQLPKHGRPYIIGSDICGIVIEIDSNNNNDNDNNETFQIGDRIIARFDEPQPHGMCAEYACVKTELSEKCPIDIPSIMACTLPASAAAAKLVAKQFITSDVNRVLVLGASGGVGTFLCQYIKLYGPTTYLAATTTQETLVKSLGVDRVIDYRTENWWEVNTDNEAPIPYDIVIDLVNGQNWEMGACSGTKLLNRQTRYIQLMMGVETEIDASSIFGIISLLTSMISRKIYVQLHPSCPRWITPQGLDLKPGDLKSIINDVIEKKIRVILDPSSPFAFETESIRNAMKLQRSIHAHGKVVIQIAKEE